MAFVGAFLSWGRLGFLMPSILGPGVAARRTGGAPFSARGLARFKRSRAEIFPFPMSSFVCLTKLRDRSCAAASIVARPAMYCESLSKWRGRS